MYVCPLPLCNAAATRAFPGKRQMSPGHDAMRPVVRTNSIELYELTRGTKAESESHHQDFIDSCKRFAAL